MKLDEIKKLAEAEADAIHHNASTLTMNFPTSEPEHGEWLDEWLELQARDCCEYLKARVHKRTGRRYTFAQYGRSGATIAPSEWYVDNMVQKGINTRKLTSGLTGLDLYNEARHIYYVLRITNQAVYARKKQLIKLWQEYLRES